MATTDEIMRKYFPNYMRKRDEMTVEERIMHDAHRAIELERFKKAMSKGLELSCTLIQ